MIRPCLDSRRSQGAAGARGRAPLIAGLALALASVVAVALGSTEARAQLAPPSPGAEALERRDPKTLSLEGYLRIRGDVFYNLDLDHGPTPSGSTLFPLPAGRPKGQLLESANMRLRLEPAWRVSRSVRVLAQVDVLDNVVLGSTPQGLPRDRWTPMIGATLGQESPESGTNGWQDAVVVRRAWGEVLLPFGVLSVGRQGALVNWGTGFFINAGKDIDADRADAADRILFATSLLDHLLLLAFEWSATGPTSASTWPAEQPFSVERLDDVRTWALGFARYDGDGGLGRRLRAGVWSVNYGVIASYRSQRLDVPLYYAPGGLEAAYGPQSTVRRDQHTVSADLWFRLAHRSFRLELEAAVIWGRIGDASLDPGLSIDQPIQSLQYGGVIQASWALGRSGVSLGIEV
ncbi:MAG: hypothetical protein RBU30_15700, partial [Polyangia bacterium]|nr:hypothetical protein [Polyangia bacterium]